MIACIGCAMFALAWLAWMAAGIWFLYYAHAQRKLKRKEEDDA